MPDDVLEEDRIIEKYPLDINPSKVEILPVEEVFQKSTGLTG
jgi:hypothetical protein